MDKYQVTHNGKTHQVRLIERKGSVVVFEVEGQQHRVDVAPVLAKFESGPSSRLAAPVSAPKSSTPAPSSPGGLHAPMPGLIVAVKVQVGDQVTLGQAVVVMEAMKMENNIGANCSGTVTEILVKAGQEVQNGSLLIKIKA